jgi:hypothetical protein
MPQISDALATAAIKILRPLVRILLRNGVTYGAFDDMVRWVYADVAMRELNTPGRKPSVSRASIVTGLSRKEIARLQELPWPTDDVAGERYSRAAGVISGWLRDPVFIDNRGNVLDLPLEGSGVSFAELVKKYSRDVTSRAMLDELLRVGAVELSDNDRVRLMTRAYVPQTDDVGKLEILGTDVSLLVDTIAHNLARTSVDARFQRKLAYDNLPQEVMDQLRSLSAAQGQQFLEQMDRLFSVHDRDVNPESSGTGRKRAGIGVYYFEEDVPSGSERESSP